MEVIPSNEFSSLTATIFDKNTKRFLCFSAKQLMNHTSKVICIFL